MGLLWGLGVGVLMIALPGVDYFHYRGAPTERALVVGQYESATQKVACGAKPLFDNTPAEVTTYRVAHPRAGFPATFHRSDCPGTAPAPGEVIDIVRSSGSEHDVMFGSALTVWDLLGMGAGWGAAAFVAAFAFWLSLGLARRHWTRWLEAGHRPTDHDTLH